MSESVRGKIIYTCIHICFWAGYCAGSGYASSYLLSIGYDNSQIGIVIAIAGLCAALLQPSAARMIDLSGRRLLKPVLLFSIILMLGLSVLLLAVPAGSLLVLGVIFGAGITCLQFMIPLINTMSITAKWKGVNFGFSRAIGSLSYSLISFLTGQLLVCVGTNTLAYIRLAAFVSMFFLVLVFPLTYHKPLIRRSQKQAEEQPAGQCENALLSESIGQTGFFKRNKGFMTIIIGCTLVYFNHSLMTYYCYQIVVSKGGDNASLGIVLAIAACVEIPVMLFFSRLLKLASSSFWFAFSGFGFVIKALCFLLAPSMPVFYIIQLTQMLGWAMITVSSVEYVRSVTSEADSTRGQACITFAYTAGLVLGSVAGGILLENFSVSCMEIVGIIIGTIGALIMTCGIKKVGSREAKFL